MLTPFWIAAPECSWAIAPYGYASHGYGVTAYSLDDAVRIIRGWGYSLPDDLAVLTIREGVTVAELDQNHVVPNMGPIVVRGLWYPFAGLGVPGWMGI